MYKPASQWVQGVFPGDKATEAWSWPLTYNLAPRLRTREAILPLTHTSSWCGE